MSSSLDAVRSAYEHLTGSSAVIRGEQDLTEDLGLDSIASLELLTLVEDRLDLRVTGDPQLRAAKTVADVCQVIDRAQARVA